MIGLIDAAYEQLAMVHQIEEGTRRMSAIVKALKSFVYLDQAPVQDVDIIAGIDWAIDNRIQVLNMSFGTYEHSELLEDAIERARNAGILMIAAVASK